MKLTSRFFILCILSVLASCQKPDLPKDTPRCLKKKVVKLEKDGCDDARADEYHFQNKTVFVLEPGSCVADGASEVLTEDCVTLGWLGGIGGNTTINGEDFQSASLVRTVWSK